MSKYLTIEEFSELTRFYMKVLKRYTSSNVSDVDMVMHLVSASVSAIDNAYEELAEVT